jgi:hypothetical protein
MPSTVSAHAIRNPGRRVQLSRRRLIGCSSAADNTTVLRNAQAKLRRAEYLDAIDKVFAACEEAVAEIAARFDKDINSVRAAVLSKSQYKATRKPSLRNALVHQRALDLHAEGGCILSELIPS